MEAVLHTAAVYGFLLVLFRITGKRSLAQITVFDVVVLLIISEATQQALVGDDFSVVKACTVIGTLMVLELALSFAKERWPTLDPIMDSVPLIVVENGHLLHERVEKERIDLSEILAAARERHGLERLDQIKYAILERSGGISIVPHAR